MDIDTNTDRQTDGPTQAKRHIHRETHTYSDKHPDTQINLYTLRKGDRDIQIF